MIVRMPSGEVLDMPSLWREGLTVRLIDQTMLPKEFSLITEGELDGFCECITRLKVRGAPAIGVFGAMALAISLAKGIDAGIAYSRLLSTRPTAVDLRNCMDRVLEAFVRGGSDEGLREADRIRDGIVRSCRSIGEYGAGLFGTGTRFLTHCNAGALATVDWGTALAPMRTLYRAGRDPFVWVSETRPLNQGSRLTAWELAMEGIRHKVVVDSACAHLMHEGEVDAVIVGADRVCANGDIANKIGTLGKAIAAHHLGVPFYVAFPLSTYDPRCPSGKDIPIEERPGSEFQSYSGSALNEGSGTWNPAFDRTPAELITAFITDRGVCDPPDIGDLLSSNG